MSGSHWGYMAEPLREMGEPMALIFAALGDLEHIVDWSESGDTGRMSYADARHRDFARAVGQALDGQDGKLPELVLGEIAEARAKLEDYLTGREHERRRADALARYGRDIGEWLAKDERGAEAEAYDRLRVLFDALEESGRFSWR